MFETIWMCTQEWSLIWSRTTALTFETCHHALICVVCVDPLEHAAELSVPADGDAKLHRLRSPRRREPCLGDDVRRWNLDDVVRLGIGRHGVSLELACVPRRLRDLGRPVAVEPRVRPRADR